MIAFALIVTLAGYDPHSPRVMIFYDVCLIPRMVLRNHKCILSITSLPCGRVPHMALPYVIIGLTRLSNKWMSNFGLTVLELLSFLSIEKILPRALLRKYSWLLANISLIGLLTARTMLRGICIPLLGQEHDLLLEWYHHDHTLRHTNIDCHQFNHDT